MLHLITPHCAWRRASHCCVACRVKVVYPGQSGEEQWITWQGRAKSLTQYTSPLDIWDEWQNGIWYNGINMRTVPLSQMEQEFEQKKHERPWRTGSDMRKHVNEIGAVIVYAMLQSANTELSPEGALTALQAEAEGQIAVSSRLT